MDVRIFGGEEKMKKLTFVFLMLVVRRMLPWLLPMLVDAIADVLRELKIDLRVK